MGNLKLGMLLIEKIKSRETKIGIIGLGYNTKSIKGTKISLLGLAYKFT